MVLMTPRTSGTSRRLRLTISTQSHRPSARRTRISLRQDHPGSAHSYRAVPAASSRSSGWRSPIVARVVKPFSLTVKGSRARERARIARIGRVM